MNDKIFLDTNILIYAFDVRDPRKQRIARQLISDGLTKGNTSISFQVVQEFINAATRKFAIPLTFEDCTQFLDRTLIHLWDVYPGTALYRNAIDIAGRWQYGFYDSLIIASGIAANSTILYSEDMQHGQKIYSIEIRNPFLES